MLEMISFDNEAHALKLCEMRASLIARNLANANTPQFKAQDINFQEAMQQVKMGATLKNTQTNHIPMSSTAGGQAVYYRVPMQFKRDENTVDNEIERKNFIENSLKYQTSLGFIERKASQYMKAIRGD